MASSATAYHTRTWLLWLLTAALAALSTRNPYYLLLIVVAARVVDQAVELQQRSVDPMGMGADAQRRGWRIFVRIGIGLALFGAVFNALSAHYGAHVLLRVPPEWPIIGGPITIEGLAYGALSGFSLVTLLLVAATFSAGSDTYALLRATPPFLYQAGVITSIGLAYVPQTLTRAQEIREAQILRGHRFRGARDILPLAVPLLAGGLERALQLAEAMEARGYSRAAGASAASNNTIRALLALGPLALVVGTFFGLFSHSAWGWSLAGGGAAALAAVLVLLTRRSQRTRYRREVWRPRDTTVSVILLLALAVLLGARLLNPAALYYSPAAELTWPDFDIVIAPALALLAAPALPLLLGQT